MDTYDTVPLETPPELHQLCMSVSGVYLTHIIRNMRVFSAALLTFFCAIRFILDNVVGCGCLFPIKPNKAGTCVSGDTNFTWPHLTLCSLKRKQIV